MKKHNNTSPARRKKTRAEIRTRNKRQLYHVTQNKKQQTPYWNDIDSLHNTAYSLLGSASNVIPLLKDVELVAKVQDRESLLQHAEQLSVKMPDYRHALDTIAAKHAGRSGVIETADEHFECLAIGQEYVEWNERFLEDVMPHVVEIKNLFDRINDHGDKLNHE